MRAIFIAEMAARCLKLYETLRKTREDYDKADCQSAIQLQYIQLIKYRMRLNYTHAAFLSFLEPSNKEFQLLSNHSNQRSPRFIIYYYYLYYYYPNSNYLHWFKCKSRLQNPRV